MYVDKEGYIISKDNRSKASYSAGLETLTRSVKPIDYFTWEEVTNLPAGEEFGFDVECYPNFFYVAFRHKDSGKVIAFEKSPSSEINWDAFMWLVGRIITVGFNSNGYDWPILAMAMQGRSNSELKSISNRIIAATGRDGAETLTPFKLQREYGYREIMRNTIDIMNVAPLQGSLKKYTARVHGERVQELPFHHETMLTAEQAEVVRLYCVNDLISTILLKYELREQMKLRDKLTAQYGIDLRSKSDAQIAEAVIGSEVKRKTGSYPRKDIVQKGHSFRFLPPAYMGFYTPYMQRKFAEICAMPFVIDETGKVVLEALAEFDITIGDTVYRMGKGGLHSKEKCAAYQADDDNDLVDTDVESFYPKLMLNSGMFPRNIGPVFLEVFGVIVDRRVSAKRSGDTDTANSLKITINGTFGKLGSRYSIMYAPELLIQVTLGGQLSLLMLIEALELANFRVISANTDGVVAIIPKRRRAEFDAIRKAWERHTNLKTEETLYSALYSRDINNYIAVKPDGSVKLKGSYSNPWADPKNAIFRFHKNPETTICIEAVVALITKNEPLSKTIRQCRDIRKFVAVKEARGGAEQNGIYLGKVVRWYYAKNAIGGIYYVESGNKVGKSEGGKPLMDLPPEFPADIDYGYYVETAEKMLYEIGFYKRAVTAALPSFW